MTTVEGTISLAEMTALARALVAADKEVAAADRALKRANEKARRLREETIPSAMHELGVDELKLTTGETISIKQEVYAAMSGVSDEMKERAFAWLDENKFGGLIKSEVIASFSRGEKDVAMELLVKLKNLGLETVMQQGIHPQTLKAFLREQLAKGAPVPLDLFAARPVWTTTVKEKKTK
jgi:hypothetical protein